jgi:chorismate mutase/prephenate dehydratase
MAELGEIRTQIDGIDDQIVELFKQRMGYADQIGAYKREHGLPVLDRTREREKIAEVTAKVPEDMQDNVDVLFQLIMEASRTRQYKLVDRDTELIETIEAAMEKTPELFPQQAFVACQGVEGAFSQIAADKLFKRPSISYFDTFDGVFRAVDQGFCKFGILPLENSTAGSVNQVYDLMMQHDFHIARSIRLKIDHNLLAKPGTKLEDVRDIYSHEQAISQCQTFLSGLDGVQVHVCDNTAMAAKAVADSDRTDVAALSSRTCAELYDLDIIKRNVQDRGNNYTRFACVSKDLEIYPGADRTSLMIVVSHTPGSLNRVLSRFYSLDINLLKLESRPLPDRDFEFMFYFDLDLPVVAPEFKTLMSSLGDVCEEFRYLGSYSEII